MKKKLGAILLAVVLVLTLGLVTAAPAAAHMADNPQVQTLYAGQNIDVGSVSVWNDGTYLYVTYEITDPDWRITETHLYVGENNPNTLTTAPGQFPYDDDDAASITDTVVSYVIPLAEIDSYLMQLNKKGKPTGVMVADGTPGVEPCNNIYIAAHAVVDTYPLCQSQGIVYGTEQVSGDLYQIDVVGGTATMIADITDPAPANDNSPNGLAFDPVSGRLYFSVYDGETATDCDLYFWDGSTTTNAGTVTGLVAGATFYNGEYYYVVNGTDDLKKVTFLGDGSVDAVLDVNIGFADPDTFRFGDIVIDPSGPTLYGSSLQSGDTPPTFFSIAPLSGTYTQLSTTDGLKLQLAYGSNGLLYGQSTGTGEFFVVDPSSGTTTSAGTPTGATNGFTDLASGELCIPDEETAWGDGTDFDQPNWAMYFLYHIQYPPIIERYPEEGNVYIGYEDWPNGDFDYNDFGMYFSAEETYEYITDGYYLTGVTMTFEAQIYDSGMDHLIHITRPIVGSSTVTVSRGIAAYGSETAAGTYTPTGDVDVVLFDTAKYTWPAKQIGEIVTVEIEVDDPGSNPQATPTTPRWDVDPFMANYDPWEIGSLYGSLYHLADMQLVAGVTSGVYPQGLDTDLVGLTLPYILVVPSDAWTPPYEDSCISGPRTLPTNGPYPDGPYAYFYDYYSTSGSSHPTWYDEITDSFVGLGGLSWSP